nr:spore germination protein [Paenibacillus turpanensis]
MFDFDQSLKTVHAIIGKSADIISREFVFHHDKNLRAAVLFTEGLVDPARITNELIKPLTLLGANLKSTFPLFQTEALQRHLLQSSKVETFQTFEKGIVALLSGSAILLVEGYEEGFIVSTMGWAKRSVDEPQSEPVVRGPRDGFTEDLQTNVALVRRRIRDPRLQVEALKVGKLSKTDVNVVYIDGLIKEGLVDEVKTRLKGINTDAILESGYIEEFIDDAPLSPFPTIQSTERPDKVAASLLEGRAAIMVDNTPFVLIVPTYFWQFLQASDDYYNRYWVGSFFRFIRYVAFFISLVLPSLYVMLTSFHHEMIPTQLALSIAAGREVVPLPVLIEALVMEIAFELMREAGLRLPRQVGQAVSIVGSLVIGEAAVTAGIVSPFMVIIIAITGIASFAIPNYAGSFAIRTLRFPLLIASGTLGLLGFSAMFAVLAIHVIHLRSFGEPYLAPATPFQPTDYKDLIFRMPWWSMKKRPSLASDDKVRLGDNQKPQPPKPEKS